MVDAGGDDLDRCGPEPFHHIIGQQRRGDIHVLYFGSPQAVAHGSSDKARLAIQCSDQGGEAASFGPV